MSSGPRVAHGGRIELRLERADAERIRYELEIVSPGGACVGSAEVAALDGSVVVRAEPEPPEWLATAVRGLLRTLWRDRQRHDAEPWPRRVTRWREPRS